jgi:hypothetical protein
MLTSPIRTLSKPDTSTTDPNFYSLVALAPNGKALILRNHMESAMIGKYQGSRTYAYSFFRIPRASLGHTGVVPADTVGRIDVGYDYFTVVGVRTAPHPWADGDMFITSSDGAVQAIIRRKPNSAAPHTYSVIVSGAAGKIWQRDIPYEPIAITAADIDVAWDRFRSEGELKPGTSEEMARKAFDDSIRPPLHMPAVHSAVVSSDTTLWIRTAGRGDSARWEVFDRQGNLVAKMTMPATFDALAASHNALWGTERAEDGEPQIVRYRVNRTANPR